MSNKTVVRRSDGALRMFLPPADGGEKRTDAGARGRSESRDAIIGRKDERRAPSWKGAARPTLN